MIKRVIFTTRLERILTTRRYIAPIVFFFLVVFVVSLSIDELLGFFVVGLEGVMNLVTIPS